MSLAKTSFITLPCAAALHAQGISKRSLTLDANLLNLPVCNGAPKQMVKLDVGGKTVREVEIEFAEGKKPDMWVFLDVRHWKGQPAVLSGPSALIAAIESGDAIKTDVPVYGEALRPQRPRPRRDLHRQRLQVRCLPPPAQARRPHGPATHRPRRRSEDHLARCA